MTLKPFGVLADGTGIDEVVIAGGGLTVSIITWGAVVRDLRLDGVGHPLVLGFDDLEIQTFEDSPGNLADDT